jgi:hypothetical protein
MDLSSYGVVTKLLVEDLRSDPIRATTLPQKKRNKIFQRDSFVHLHESDSIFLSEL